MPFGPDCEFNSLTECARKYRGKVFDEWAYCQTIRKRTEIPHCGGLAAQLHLPEPPIDSAAGSLSVRHEWEMRITTLAEEGMARFLFDVEKLAREALTAPVVLAAGPFSRTAVRNLWNRLTRRHEILSELPEDELTELAYTETAEILASPAPDDDKRSALTDYLGYEQPERSPWEARTGKAARTYATRVYNEAAIDRLARSGYGSKRWVSRRDEYTRHSHREADGQTVALHEAFTVGSALLAYPGDETGPAGETYNCRCVVVGA